MSAADAFMLGGKLLLTGIACWTVFNLLVGAHRTLSGPGPHRGRRLLSDALILIGGVIMVGSLIAGPIAWIYIVDALGGDPGQAASEWNQAQDQAWIPLFLQRNPLAGLGHFLMIGVGWAIAFGIIGIANRIAPPDSVRPPQEAQPRSQPRDPI